MTLDKLDRGVSPPLLLQTGFTAGLNGGVRYKLCLLALIPTLRFCPTGLISLRTMSGQEWSSINHSYWCLWGRGTEEELSSLIGFSLCRSLSACPLFSKIKTFLYFHIKDLTNIPRTNPTINPTYWIWQSWFKIILEF